MQVIINGVLTSGKVKKFWNKMSRGIVKISIYCKTTMYLKKELLDHLVNFLNTL